MESVVRGGNVKRFVRFVRFERFCSKGSMRSMGSKGWKYITLEKSLNRFAGLMV